MKISFDEIDEKVIEHFFDGEGAYITRMAIVNDNKIMRGCLKPGCSIGTHTHNGACEFIFITSGYGKAVCDGVEERLSAGDCHHCPEGSTHTLINSESDDLTFFAVVAKQ